MRWLVILLVLLVACQPFNLKPKGPVALDVFKGVSAVDVVFNPASLGSVFMCNNFDVFVDLRNRGAFDVKGGKYQVIVGNGLKSVSKTSGSFDVIGKSVFAPSGSFEQLRFNFESLALPEQFGSFSSEVIFESCYNYRTFADVNVCVDPDVASLQGVKACRVGPVVLSGGQGAPVEVLRVEPIMASDGGSVKFYVSLRESGSGFVVAKDSCDFGKGPGASEVGVSVKFRGSDIECTPSKFVLSSDRDSVFYCGPVDIDKSVGAFNSILSVELSYGYVSGNIFPVTINRLPGQTGCD